MHFLLVNDDGIQSPLLHALCAAAVRRGHRVTVSAPASQQSAKSHAFTIVEPVLARPAEVPGAQEAWAVSGTPVDCARLGLLALGSQPVDLVISGINDGLNSGMAAYVSGTVGAAREAAFLRGRALASSVPFGTSPEKAAWCADYTVRVAECLSTFDAPAYSVCNLNFPACEPQEMLPPVLAPLSEVVYNCGYAETVSPRGDRYFWPTPEVPALHVPAETDLGQLNAGHISFTFLTVNGIDQRQCAGFLDLLQTAL